MNSEQASLYLVRERRVVFPLTQLILPVTETRNGMHTENKY
jgi:hypothetical protein